MRSWPTTVAFGGDYNPEQWPETVWADDVALMTEAGVTFVTVGVFAWSVLEPEPGRYETAWLDRVLDLLADADIAVDLATGTASPPSWLSRTYPQSLPVDREGRTLWPGGRQAWCPSSADFRRHGLALVEHLADRYRDHPALAMWHVSNEYACHNAPCYCDACALGFRGWLERRYGTPDALDEAWGASFWSQRHASFDDVLPPRLAPTPSNPTQVLDYARFTSDTLLDAYRAERDVLHRISPGVPVTTNFMTVDHFRHLDYFAWAPEQDVVSTDHYLDGARADPEAELAFGADLTRGLASGQPWLLMEHSNGAVNWQPVNRAKEPGQMLRNSLGHVARGADTLGFFQWRASRAGSEKFHSALVPHAGTDTRLWRDVVHLGQVCARLGEVVGSRVEANVALLWDYQAGWACDQPFHPSSLVGYGATAHRLHAALRAQGVTVDVVHPTADLSGYRVVLVPTLYLVGDDLAGSLRSAVEAGAQVLVTYFSGIVDESDHVRLGGYPGAFRDLLGVRVEEFSPLAAGEVVGLAGDDGRAGTATLWSEDLRLEGATCVLTYTHGPLAGVPALTRHDVQQGAAWYLATEPDDATLASVLAELAGVAGVAPAAAAPAGVEVVRRTGASDSYLFVLNHTDEPVSVPVDGYDLVADTAVRGGLELVAGGVAVVRER